MCVKFETKVENRVFIDAISAAARRPHASERAGAGVRVCGYPAIGSPNRKLFATLPFPRASMRLHDKPPLPTRLPNVNTELSAFYIQSKKGDNLNLHPSMLVRIQQSHPLSDIGSSSCADNGLFGFDGWPALRANDIIVLQILDFEGKSAYGWFARFEKDPSRLLRVPTMAATGLLVKLHENERLKRCSLYDRLTDCSMFDEDFLFDEILDRKLRMINRSVKPFRKRKRSKQDGFPVAHVPDVLSMPSSPRRNMDDCCSLCLEEVEVTPSSCCGLAGGSCRTCSENLRGLCTLCDRKVLTSMHECGVCKKEHSFQESGFPCCGCGAAAVCSGCYTQMSVCWDCLGKP